VKVGDLVELSAYGRNLKNYYENRSDDVALIVGVGLYEETFVIAWCSDGYRHRSVARKDIRHVKNNKSR